MFDDIWMVFTTVFTCSMEENSAAPSFVMELNDLQARTHIMSNAFRSELTDFGKTSGSAYTSSSISDVLERRASDSDWVHLSVRPHDDIPSVTMEAFFRSMSATWSQPAPRSGFLLS